MSNHTTPNEVMNKDAVSFKDTFGRIKGDRLLLGAGSEK
jgi:hypothetical protein